MEIVRTFTMKLEGDENIRYASEFPEFTDMSGHYLTEIIGLFNSPHEFCLVTAIEFARRYPNHTNSETYRKEFSDEEMLDIAQGRRRLVFKKYNMDPSSWQGDFKTRIARKIKKILPRLSLHDFSKEPVELIRIYDYWLQGDTPQGKPLAGLDFWGEGHNPERKPRGGVNVPQFSNVSLYKAKLNKWVREDADYSIMAELEFCRRNPKHKFAKESQYYKLFSNDEILDIAKGKKKLIIENSYE